MAAVVITEDKEKEDGEDLIQEEEELMLTKLKEEVLKEVLEERRRAVKRKKTEEEKELDRAASEGLRRAAKEALIKDMGVIRAKGKVKKLSKDKKMIRFLILDFPLCFLRNFRSWYTRLEERRGGERPRGATRR